MIISEDYIKIKLTKVKEADNPEHPNNIPEGTQREGLMYQEPKVGECFYLQYENKLSHFRTSIVQEIIDKDTFRTYNSIYKIERL